MEKRAAKRIYGERRFLWRLFLSPPASRAALVRTATPAELLACLHLLESVIRDRLTLPPALEKALRKLKGSDWLASQFGQKQSFRSLLRDVAKDPDRGREAVLRAGRALGLSLKVLFHGG